LLLFEVEEDEEDEEEEEEEEDAEEDTDGADEMNAEDALGSLRFFDSADTPSSTRRNDSFFISKAAFFFSCA
jgi:hypothetical protein